METVNLQTAASVTADAARHSDSATAKREHRNAMARVRRAAKKANAAMGAEVAATLAKNVNAITKGVLAKRGPASTSIGPQLATFKPSKSKRKANAGVRNLRGWAVAHGAPRNVIPVRVAVATFFSKLTQGLTTAEVIDRLQRKYPKMKESSIRVEITDRIKDRTIKVVGHVEASRGKPANVLSGPGYVKSVRKAAIAQRVN